MTNAKEPSPTGDTRLIQTTKKIKKDRQPVTMALTGDHRPTLSRPVIFVNPDDDESSYWWPGVIVPRSEIAVFRATMDPTVQIPSEVEDLVVYFEDASFSLVPKSDQKPFDPTCEPFTTYMNDSIIAQRFQSDRAVQLAMQYIRTAYLPKAFKWAWNTVDSAATEDEDDISIDEPPTNGERQRRVRKKASGNDAASEKSVSTGGRKRRRNSISSTAGPVKEQKTSTRGGRRATTSSRTTRSPGARSRPKDSVPPVYHLLPPILSHLFASQTASDHHTIAITSNGYSSTNLCTSCGGDHSHTLIDHYLCVDCSMNLDNMLGWKATSAAMLVNGGPAKHKYGVKWGEEDEPSGLDRILGYGVTPLGKRQRMRLLADGVNLNVEVDEEISDEEEEREEEVEEEDVVR